MASISVCAWEGERRRSGGGDDKTARLIFAALVARKLLYFLSLHHFIRNFLNLLYLNRSRPFPLLLRRMSARLLSLVFFLIALVPFRCGHAADVLPQYESSTVNVDQPNAATWRTVQFAHAFVAPPVVITGPVTMADLAPVTVRVRNVTATGFEYQMDEWDYLDGTHGKEKFSYLAVQTGLFQIGAVTWQAGRVSSVTGAEQPVVFPTAFAKQPVVFAQVETTNNAQALITRLDAVTPTQFGLRIQAQASDTTTLVGESVGYLAATPGTAKLDGASFFVGRPAYGFAAPWRGYLPWRHLPESQLFRAAAVEL